MRWQSRCAKWGTAAERRDPWVQQAERSWAGYVSDAARCLDEEIFCYVPEEILGEKKPALVGYIERNIL